MPTYRVTLADGRTMDVCASDESTVVGQAVHAERTRFILAVKRAQDPGPNPSQPVSLVKIKD
jgi:hypothetical protein